MSPGLFDAVCLCFILFFISQSQGQCEIPLIVDQNQSSLNLTGASLTPVQAQIIYTDEQDITFSGTINLQILSGECPSSLSQISNDQNVRLITNESIIISPQIIDTQVAANADSPVLSTNQFQDLSAIIESEEFRFENGKFGDVVANFRWATGSVKASSVFLGSPLEQSIVDGASSQFLISGIVLSDTLVWENLSVVLPFSQQVSGINVTGELEFYGNLAFQIEDLQSSNGGGNPQFVQIEENGVSDIDSKNDTGAMQNAASSFDGDCSPRYKENLCGLCECDEGWEGYGCSKCRSTQSCLSWLGIDPTTDEDAIGVRCGSDFVYGPGTQMKAYKCELDGQQGNILAPGSLAFTCLTTQDPYQLATLRPELRYSQNDPLFLPLNESQMSEGGSCTVTFALRQFPKSPLTCFAAGCQFQANSANIQCPVTQCECPQSGCAVQELLAITQTIQNGVTMECDKKSGTCDISLQDLQGLKLRGNCQVGECVVPTAALVVGDDGFESEDDRWKQILIAATPLMLVFVVFVFLFICVLTDARFYKIQIMHSRPIAEAIEPDMNAMHTAKNAKKDKQLWFTNVQCTLPRCNKVILDKVSGYASSGEILAIVGPSGSGKTTLLNILANSSWDIAASSIIKSDIKLLLKSSNKAVSGDACNRLMAFVPQEDTLLPSLTVQETLRYAAILKSPLQNPTSQMVNHSIQKVVKDLGLTKIFNSKVGGEGVRGISGGEKRRVSIAMELLTSPQILLLDEPTSGLDSFTASSLINLLKSIAVENDRIVAASLHQPSAEIFARLDKVLLLAQGKVAYYGGVSEVEGFLQNVGLPCTQQAFIAEHLLKVVQDSQNLTTMFTVNNQNMDRHLATVNGTSYQEIEAAKDIEGDKLKVFSQFLKQSKVLFWRSLLEVWRNPQFLLMHILLGALMGLIVGVIFYQVEDDTAGAQNRSGAFFFTLAMFAYSSITTVDLLMAERRLVFREVRGNYYSLLPYIISKITLDNLFLRALPCVLYTLGFYFLMGLNTNSVKIGVFAVVLSVFTCVMGNIAVIVVAFSRTPGQVVMIINSLYLLFLLVAGFLVATPSIPGVIRWVHYISVFSYAFEILLINEIAGLDLVLTLEGIGSVLSDGEAFISTLGMNVDDFNRDIWVLVVFYFASATFAWLSTWVALSIKPIYMKIRNYFSHS